MAGRSRPVIAPLEQALVALLGEAQLRPMALEHTGLSLWLLDPEGMQRAFSPEETRRLLEAPPYWCFCWGSGLALARWLLQHPEQVQGRRVLDVGAGSGIAALAALKAGAAEAVACDLDPLARLACTANAQLNALPLRLSEDLFHETQQYDLILAADLLYDRENHPLLEHFLRLGQRVLVADSRVRHLEHPAYERLTQLEAQTLPDLGEPDEYRQVSLYQSRHP